MASTSAFLPRDLHPGAWWLWSLGLAVAASRTTNPWLLLLILAVACHVVVMRRSDAPWAMAFRLYLYLAAVIVVVRVAFRVLLGGSDGQGTVLVHLPTIPLPQWVAGIQLLGDVTAESVLAGLYDGLRLATMVVCLGAANALANPNGCSRRCPPRCTRSAPPSSWRCRCSRSSPRARSACAVPVDSVEAPTDGSTCCTRSSCRSSRTPSTARSSSRPRWTRGATGAPARHRPAPAS